MTVNIRCLLPLLFLINSFSINAANDFPLKTLPDDKSRDYWVPQQVNSPGVLDQFQQIVSKAGESLGIQQKQPVRIAVIYPSKDVSDFGTRSYLALTKRLDEMGVQYTTKEFSSRQIEHSLQTRYTDEVLSHSADYDIVIFGPSELSTQAKNIQRLSASGQFHTFIWAFHTPIKIWQSQPKIWFDFSSSVGAEAICQYLIQRLGFGVKFAMNRGIPGITDNQRSGEFKSCVEQEGGWKVIYEHFGQYQKAGGSDGTRLVNQYFPEVNVLHNANTAMAVGSVEALQEMDQSNTLYTTGWGGTDVELKLIREGKLNATPMRMGDDVGVASAEAIKFILQGKDKQLPVVYLGRITVANDTMSAEEIDRLEQEAFRYSGVGVINR